MSFHDWWTIVVRWLFMHFSYDFLVLPIKNSDMSVKFKKLFNLTHHKHEPQSLENFVSLAIQGTQVPMYTKHTLFLYFSDFSIIFFILYEKQNKSKTEK